MAAAGLAERVGGLDADLDWAHTLRMGEQQRIAFLRLLLHRPAVRPEPFECEHCCLNEMLAAGAQSAVMDVACHNIDLLRCLQCASKSAMPREARGSHGHNCPLVSPTQDVPWRRDM